ncbi:WhiB family transcriptional regulator [Streptomyces sp. NPDC001404]|uniref:WhiB family transcriptional regulator n=1 Tax=Streptomyces sp. NPDC001404 TaxID=3364571 RepID=UPI00369553A7
MSAPAWEDQALCRQTDPGLFMPDDYSPKRVEQALATCWRCPVRDACLADALTEERGLPQHMRTTIRGATTPRQRVAIDRRARDRETA